MTLSPTDVEQKTFSTALRGYDLDEVDDFLDEVVATIRELNEQLEEQQPGGAPPAPVPGEAAISETREESGPDEAAVGRALVAAQETADRIVAEAREEAERIVADARDEADTLSSERSRRRAEAEAEMEELSQLVAGVRSQLAVLATAVADRLDEMNGAIEEVTENVGEEATEPDTEMGASGEDEVEEFTLDDEGGGDGDTAEESEESEESEGSEQVGSEDEEEASDENW